jgi:hypothetical protein
VGDQEKEWRIPTDLLCYHSGYFRSALKGEFAESQIRRVELRDEKPEAFALVVEWLYTHKIELNDAQRWNMYMEEPSFNTLLKTWVLADYLQLPKLQNIIMKVMDDRVTFHKEVPIADVSRAYQGFDTKLNKWILDICVWVILHKNETVDYFTEISDLELLKDIMRKLLGEMSAKKKFVLDSNYLVTE